MQKLRPIVAPGWMSMPVRVWATSDRRRGRTRTPSWWISWATRWIAMARKPGYAATTSSVLSAAGSPATIASPSSRIRS